MHNPPPSLPFTLLLFLAIPTRSANLVCLVTSFCYAQFPLQLNSSHFTNRQPPTFVPLPPTSGLRCFFRSDSRAIPGCQGEGIRAKDYCYDPTFVATSQRDPNPTAPPPTPQPPTPRPPTNPPPTAPALQFATLKRVSNKNCGKGQCGKCEGDCDNDKECQNGM